MFQVPVHSFQTNHKFSVVGIEPDTKNVTGNDDEGKIAFSETGREDVQAPVETCFHACFPVSKLNGMHQKARVQGSWRPVAPLGIPHPNGIKSTSSREEVWDLSVHKYR